MGFSSCVVTPEIVRTAWFQNPGAVNSIRESKLKVTTENKIKLTIIIARQ